MKAAPPKKSIYVEKFDKYSLVHMHRLLGFLSVVLIIGAPIGSCEEAAYAFGEAGAVRLDRASLSELNGSEIATFSVTTGSGDTSGGAICPGDRNLSVIKKAIEQRIERNNSIVKREADSLALRFPGDHSVEQVCAIFDYLIKSWNYTGDPRCEEYYKYASETIQLGKDYDLAGAGDCDDFAILMSSLIENIGGTTRINLVYNELEGHAYTEVCIGKLNGSDNRVNKTVSWLERRYDTETVYAHVDNDSNNVWLNLDWWADHPGGLFYAIDNHVNLVRIRPDLPIVPLNPPNIPPIANISYSPEEPNARETMTFDASRSLDPYGEIVDYNWYFGDGEDPENGPDPISYHNYQRGGTKTVTLTVTDDEGEMNSSTSVIEVNEPPVAEFRYIIEDTISGYLVFKFQNNIAIFNTLKCTLILCHL